MGALNDFDDDEASIDEDENSDGGEVSVAGSDRARGGGTLNMTGGRGGPMGGGYDSGGYGGGGGGGGGYGGGAPDMINVSESCWVDKKHRRGAPVEEWSCRTGPLVVSLKLH